MDLRFRLNHFFQGQNAPFLYASDAGLFADAGIGITFLEGFSSSQVTRVLTEGGAELGFGDVSSVIEHAIRSGSLPISALMPIYVRSPCCLGYHRRSPPLALADLEGAELCGPKGDTSARLLPALLAINDLAHLPYTLHVVAPEERDRLIAERQVLAATCFDATLKFAMLMRGHDSSDIDFLYFADHGLDAYSSALICLTQILDAHPGLGETLRAITRQAWDDCRADPQRGVRAVLARAPDLDPKIVRAQLEWVIEHQIHPGTQRPFTFLRDSSRFANTLTVAEFGATGKWALSERTRQLAALVCQHAD